MRFTGTLTTANDTGGRWVECPFDSRTEFGQSRPPIVGTVNGTPFRTRLMVYGGTTYIGFTKDVRAAAGIDEGSPLEIDIELDTAPRVVDEPPALTAALEAHPQARAAYDALAFTHRKEYAQWIAEAKRTETRERRTAQAVRLILDGTKHP